MTRWWRRWRMYSQFLHLRPNCQTPIQAWETLNPNMSHAGPLLSLSHLKRWCTQMYHDSSWQNLTIQQSEWWLACDLWAHMMVMAPPPPPSQPALMAPIIHCPPILFQNIAISDFIFFNATISSILIIWGFHHNFHDSYGVSQKSSFCGFIQIGTFYQWRNFKWLIKIFEPFWIFWLNFFHSCSLASAIMSLIFFAFLTKS